jgi:hypothetical protein
MLDRLSRSCDGSSEEAGAPLLCGTPIIRPVLLSRNLVRVARLDRLDAVLAATIIVLASLSAAVVFLPMLGGQHVEAGLDLVLDTFATVVSLGVAVVAWVRYREIGAPVALFQASAFLVLAFADRRRGLKPFRDCRLGFQQSFYGGLLVGCGLRWMGARSTDGEEPLGLHGRLSNTPAEQVAVDKARLGRL